jgi:hypothetical protein
MGHITIISTDEEITQADVVEEEVDRIRIALGGVSDALQAVALLDQIRNLLDETHAYRAYSLQYLRQN